MLSLILAFLGLGVVAYLLRNPKFLGIIIVFFLFAISLFTPFWPFVMLGLFALFSLVDNNKKTQK